MRTCNVSIWRPSRPTGTVAPSNQPHHNHTMKRIRLQTAGLILATIIVAPPLLAQAPGSAYSQAVLTNKPLAYWRLNETADPSTGSLAAADASGGGFNGTYGSAAMNGFNNIAGPRPSAFPGFEASNDALQTTAGTDLSWVTAPQPMLNTNTVTFTAWLFPNGDQADWTGILMDRSGDGEGIGFAGGTTHGMLTYTWNNNNAATYNFNSGLTIPPDQWSFVAVVIEPDKATLYLGTGGVLTNAVNAIAHISEPWGGTAAIGNDTCCGAGRIYNGIVDEVAVFDKALSLNAITTLYGTALGKTFAPTVIAQPTAQSLYAGRTAHFQVTVGGSLPLTYQWSKGATKLQDGGNISGAATPTLTLSNVSTTDAGDYTLTISNTAGSVTSSVATLAVVAPTSTAYEKAVMAANPLAYWRLNETNNPSTGTVVAHDYAGGFAGTYGSASQNGFNNIAGPRPTAFPGFEASNTALQATASTDQSWVTAPQPTLNTNTVTFTAWLYPSGDQADWTGIFMDRSGVGEGIGFGGGATHGMLTYTWNNNSGTTYNFNSGLVLPQEQWAFVAVVIEPTQAVLYLGTGGVLTNAINAIAHINEAWGGNAAIGADPGFNNARIFNGIVDEVAVFNQALSFDAINTLYGTALGKVQVVSPTISTQPASASLYAGRTAVFRATANGSAPLTYQWKKGGTSLKDGGNISGSATATLTVSSIAAADAGDYTVTISNAGGSVTSSVATLAVITPTSAAYEKAMLSANPLAYWRLNETKDPSSGTAAAFDYAGGYNGTYGTAAMNGFNNVAGPRPPAFSIFEAANDALQVTAGTDQSWVTAPQPTLNTNTVTFTAWLYPSGDQADWTGLIMNRSADGEGIGFGGGATHGMLTYTWNNNTAATYNFNSGLTLPQDQWSFVAVAIGPNEATLYLGNGGKLTSATNAIAHINEPWGGTAAFGDDPGFSNGRVFNGMVDEVAIFGYTLTPQAVQNLFTGVAQLPTTQSKLSISPVTSGHVTISWSGTGKLQSTPALQGSQTVWTDAGASSPVTVTAGGAATFYRVVGP